MVHMHSMKLQAAANGLPGLKPGNDDKGGLRQSVQRCPRLKQKRPRNTGGALPTESEKRSVLRACSRQLGRNVAEDGGQAGADRGHGSHGDD